MQFNSTLLRLALRPYVITWNMHRRQPFPPSSSRNVFDISLELDESVRARVSILNLMHLRG